MKSPEIEQAFTDRDAKYYAEWMGGKRYKQLAYEFKVSIDTIKSGLRRHRKKNNLPNGRKFKKENDKQ